MYLTKVDEVSCCLLIMLGEGQFWVTKFSLSILIRCYYRKYFRHHFLIIIIIKRKENLTGWWHARNTHFMQTGSSRIFKGMVLVDYYQSKMKYQEHFLLLVQ